MKWRHLFLAFSIMLIIVGLIKSIHYENIVGTNGAGYEIGFKFSSELPFGLMGFALYFAEQWKAR
ncbi:MAG: hypothetical protein AB8H12_00645 [Lewinella sp.]